MSQLARRIAALERGNSKKGQIVVVRWDDAGLVQFAQTDAGRIERLPDEGQTAFLGRIKAAAEHDDPLIVFIRKF